MQSDMSFILANGEIVSECGEINVNENRRADLDRVLKTPHQVQTTHWASPALCNEAIASTVPLQNQENDLQIPMALRFTASLQL